MAEPILPEPAAVKPANPKSTRLAVLSAVLLLIIAGGILLVLHGLKPADTKSPAAVLSPSPQTQDVSSLESLLSTTDTSMTSADSSLNDASQSFNDQQGDLSE